MNDAIRPLIALYKEIAMGILCLKIITPIACNLALYRMVNNTGYICLCTCPSHLSVGLVHMYIQYNECHLRIA